MIWKLPSIAPVVSVAAAAARIDLLPPWRSCPHDRAVSPTDLLQRFMPTVGQATSRVDEISNLLINYRQVAPATYELRASPDDWRLRHLATYRQTTDDDGQHHRLAVAVFVRYPSRFIIIVLAFYIRKSPSLLSGDYGSAVELTFDRSFVRLRREYLRNGAAAAAAAGLVRPEGGCSMPVS